MGWLRVPSLAVLVASVVLAGCGEDGASSPDPADDGPRDRVLDAVVSFSEAVGDGDGDAACATLTEGGQRFVIRGAAAEGAGTDVETCPEAITALADATQGDDGGLAGLDDSLSVDDVSITDDRATIQCRDRGAIPLRRVGGEWLLQVPGCFD